jgi:hypothetical protein
MDNLENTYLWLRKDGDPFPQHVLGALVRQMHAAVRQKNSADALALMDEARYVSDQAGDPLVQARVRLECARADYNLGRNDEAMQDLMGVIRLLKVRSAHDASYKYYGAIANWMLGTLLVKMPDQRQAALVAWQACLDAFESLVLWAVYENSDPTWYRDRCTEMRQGLDKAISSAPAKPARPVASPPKSAKFKFPISTLYSGNLKSIPIVGEIPAGGFGPSGIDSHILEKLKLEPSMDEFLIGGESFRLVNLRSSPGVTQLVSSKTYYILKVKGDSMDKALIDPDDYVLLRQQSSADPYDIVAAEVVHIDTEATLKLFVHTPNGVELQPRSKNPKHKRIPVSHHPGGFHIRGIVLGVFKKV